MPRPPGQKEDPLRRAEALIRNPTGVTAAELLELIHRINPTGRQLHERDTSARYRVKSALQSVLVEQFDDDLLLERSADPRVIGLRHRYLDTDACHAILDELTEEARSRIRRRLDLDTENGLFSTTQETHLPGEARRTRGGEAHAAGRVRPMQNHGAARFERSRARAHEAEGARGWDLLSLGRRALEEYDFEEAKRCFEKASAQQAFTIVPTRALLELLVDYLYSDAEALALAEILPRATQSDPQVRLLLARAAARMGERERALSWIEGFEHEGAAEIEHEGAAEVLIACARRSLQDGARREAKRLAGRARRLCPGHDALVSFEQELARQPFAGGGPPIRNPGRRRG